MRIDAAIGNRFGEVTAMAPRYESQGYAGIWSTEAGHDPFLPLGVAAGVTARIQLGTAIAVAFAHSPLSVAQVAHDLQVESHGRFVLGLGSQVKAHIKRRYAMPWGQPAARMREFVLALRAIWAAWNEGADLDFRGTFFEHTLMIPLFSPEPSEWGPPKVFVAGVNPEMTRVAGEVADGFLAHPFTTERYLREVTLPNLKEGRRRGDRGSQPEVALPVLIVSGRTEEEFEAAAERARGQIAFYASTAAYRAVLACHGWEELQVDLARLARAGRWDEMRHCVGEEVLRTFAVVAEPHAAAAAVGSRFDGLVQRVSAYDPGPDHEDLAAEILREVAATGDGPPASGEG